MVRQDLGPHVMGPKPKKNKTQNFYDRIADVHDLMMKINGYRDSVAKYLGSLSLEVDEESVVLDAGSGTGMITKGFFRAGFKPRRMVAFDLSHKSLQVSQEQFEKDRFTDDERVSPVQGNLLQLPFADSKFDLVLACGVLEYVALDKGLAELSRVMKTGSRLVLIPVKPSFVGSVLKTLYNFKIHPLEEVRRASEECFRIIGDGEFPITEPISWSKTIFHLEKR